MNFKEYLHDHALAAGIGSGVAAFLLLSAVTGWFKKDIAKGPSRSFIAYVLKDMGAI